MSKKLTAAATVFVVLAGLAGLVAIQLSGARAVADEPNLQEGIPVTFHLVNATVSDTGGTFVYRTGKLGLCVSNDAALLHDAGYQGQRGTWGDSTWIYVPEGYTITVFPGEATNPKMPTWAGEATAFIAAHPDLRVVTCNQHPGRMINGQYVEKPDFAESIPPINPAECSPAKYAQNALEYRLQVSGNMTGFQAPQTLEHFVYRIQEQTPE
jgi:hypothetical protein